MKEPDHRGDRPRLRGLPLAVEFAKHFQTLGFDIDADTSQELRAGHDRTLEVSDEELATATVA